MKLKQLLQHFVVRHAQANGFSGRVTQAAGHFFAGFQNEGVRARRGRFDESKLLVIHTCVVGQFRQVAAQESEVVLVIHPTNAAQFVGGGLVIDVTDQGVAGICGDSDDFAFFQQRDRLFEQTNLRVVGVYFK